MEELLAAEEAKKVIDTLSVSSPDNETIKTTLRQAYDQARRGATPILSSAEALNAARNEVGIALPNLIGALKNGSLSQKKIDGAKAAVNAWIMLLTGH